MGKYNPKSQTFLEAAHPATSGHYQRGFYSTVPNEQSFVANTRPLENVANMSESTAPTASPQNGPLGPRINWEIKALVPIACVLLGGMLLFLLATFSWRDPERHAVLLVAGTGAVAICGALLVVLTYQIQRPLVELQEKIEKLGEGDLEVAVNFAHRNDEIGDLGRNFNHMVQQLRETRQEIERLHRTQMSRAEHLATLGELATGLAHEIRNPLAGIAGVIEIIGRDLPATSPARAVVKEVRQAIARINQIVTDLLQTARPHPPQTRKSDLNVTVEHAVMLGRQHSLSRPVEIWLNKDASLPEIEHDSDQIHQVLLNLLLNALQAINGDGTITVRCEWSGGYSVEGIFGGSFAELRDWAGY